jgi:hypothetical protein
MDTSPESGTWLSTRKKDDDDEKAVVLLHSLLLGIYMDFGLSLFV